MHIGALVDAVQTDFTFSESDTYSATDILKREIPRIKKLDMKRSTTEYHLPPSKLLPYSGLLYKDSQGGRGL